MMRDPYDLRFAKSSVAAQRKHALRRALLTHSHGSQNPYQHCPECGAAHGRRELNRLCVKCEKEQERTQRKRNRAIILSRKLVRTPEAQYLVNTMGEPMELYNLKSTNTPGQYIIAKFDKNMELESNYLCSMEECACPRGTRPTCRHRQMLPLFKKHKHIDDGWFLDFHTKQWHNIPGFTDQVEDAHDTSSPDAPAAEEQQPAAQVTLPASSAPEVPHPTPVPAAGNQPKHKPALLGLRPL